MRLLVADIQRGVAAHYGTTVAEMKADARNLRQVQPRHVAMYLAKDLTHQPMAQLGRFFDRHRSSVLHACRRIDRLLQEDPELSDAVGKLRAEFEG